MKRHPFEPSKSYSLEPIKRHPLESWILELKELKNFHNFVDSWVKFDSVVLFARILFDQGRFMKLLDPRIFRILLSRDSRGSRINLYFMIKKGVVLLVVGVLISRMTNRNMVERKTGYLMGLLPIPMNSIGPRNETLEESFWSTNINRLIVSLLHFPKGKTISESSFMDPQESTWVLPKNQNIMPESNRGSQWWRNQIGKKRDSSCKISNETVAGILKGSSDQSRDHFDSIRNADSEDHKWIDETEIQRLESICSEIESDRFPKCLFGSSSMSRIFTEHEKQMNNHPLPEETEEFLGNPTRSIRSFFSDKWSELHLRSNPTERSTRDQKFWKKKKQDVSFVPFRQSEKQEMVDLFKIITYLQNTVSIHPISSDPGCYMVPKDESDSSNKISFLNKNPFLGLFPDRNKGECTLRHDLESEERFQEMANRFTLSITEPDLVYHRGFAFSIDSYGLDQKKFLNGVFNSRDESKKKSLLVLPPLFYEENESFYRNRRIRNRIHCGNDLEDPKRKRVLFASIMETVNQYRLIRNLIQIPSSAWGYIRNVSNRFFLMVMNRSRVLFASIMETVNQYGLIRNLIQIQSSAWGYIRNVSNRFFLMVMNRSRVLFASIMETVNQYGLIRNLIQIQSSAWGYIRNVSNRFFLMVMNRSFEYGIPRDEIGNDTLNHIMNHITRMEYTINQHFLKKSQKKWFDPLISRTERSMNRDPDAYIYEYEYEWADRFQDLLEHFLSDLEHFLSDLEHFLSDLEHFLSEQKNRFQPVFDAFYSIDWCGVFYARRCGQLYPFVLSMSRSLLSKSLFFLVKRFPPFSVSIGKSPIHRSEIHIYELKDPNDHPFNQFLESMGVRFVHQWVRLKKLKPFLLDDPDTSQRPKFFINGALPFLFNKIPKRMIDSFHTRNNGRKSLDNTDSYFSMIYHDRDNWLNPVKPFHRSSLISSFYKANRLRFLKNPRHFWFYCNKGFPFYVEKTRIHNDDLTYGQFLNIFFIRNKRVSLGLGKKKHIFLERETISPIDLQVSDIFIPKDFPQSGDERYNLYKSFHFPIRFEPFVRRAIYSIADISATPLTEEQIVNLERTYYQPLSDMNLSDSEGKNLHQYLGFNSNMGLIHTLYSEKYLPSAKRKKRSLGLKKWVEKREMDRTFQGDSAFSTKWNLFKTYMPWFLTSTGCKYLRFILLDTLTFSNLLPILKSRSPKLVSFFYEIMHESSRSWLILQNKLRAILAQSQWNRISEISRKWFQNWVLPEEMIPPDNESPLPLIWTHLISTNAWELFYSIVLFLLVVGYFALRHLLLVWVFSSELEIELQKIKDLMNPLYIMETDLFMGGPKPIFRVALKQFISFMDKMWDSALFLLAWDRGKRPRFYEPKRKKKVKPFRYLKKKCRTIVNGLISIIRNSINRITFWIKTSIYLSAKSQEFYSLLREAEEDVRSAMRKEKRQKGIEDPISKAIEMKEMRGEWIDGQVDFWVVTSNLFQSDEKGSAFLVQLGNLPTERSIGQILLSLTHSDDHFSKKDPGLQSAEGPGSNYLRNLVDIHNKSLVPYEFNRSCLAELRIFIAHHEKMTYSQAGAMPGSIGFPSSTPKRPHSLRLTLSPSRGILVIGSRGTGRSYLVKYLATNSYVPFVTIVPDKKETQNTYVPKGYMFDGMECDAVFGAPSGPSMRERLFGFVRDRHPRNPKEGIDPSFFGLSNSKYENLDSFRKDWERIDDFETLLILGLLIGGVEKDEETQRPDVGRHLRGVKRVSPCIIWIPNIQDLYLNTQNTLRARALFLNYLSRSSKESITRKNLLIASTHLPRKVDPVLIDRDTLSTCIKIRRLLIPHQRQHFCILLYTRGFHLEKHPQQTFEEFGKRSMGANARDVAGLVNEALALSIAQKKSILETDLIRASLHNLTWDLRSHDARARDPGVVFYQIGRAVVQNQLLRDFPPDPISIYIKMLICPQTDPYWSSWYFELGRNTKRFTVLLYILSCSAGSVAQDLWYPLGLEERKRSAYYLHINQDSAIAHELLQLEGTLVGFPLTEKDCSQNKNKGVTLLLRSEPKNPFDTVKYGASPLLDYGFHYDQEWKTKFDPNKEQEKPLFNEIVWAPRAWRPWANLQVLDSIERMNQVQRAYLTAEFAYEADPEADTGWLSIDLEDREADFARHRFRDRERIARELRLEQRESAFVHMAAAQYETQDKYSQEQGFFQRTQFIWDPTDPFFFLFADDEQPPRFVFLQQDLFEDRRISAFRFRKRISKRLAKGWINEEEQIKDFEALRRRKDYMSGIPPDKRSFRSHALFECYQYLSNLFLSNRMVLDHIAKTLFRKRWLLLEELAPLVKLHTRSGAMKKGLSGTE
nr:hypothetical protein RF2 [Sagittaria trifolia]